MSNRDTELKETFLKLFSIKLREIAPGYFDRRKIDPLVGNISFSDEDLEEIESDLKHILLRGERNEPSED